MVVVVSVGNCLVELVGRIADSGLGGVEVETIVLVVVEVLEL